MINFLQIKLDYLAKLRDEIHFFFFYTKKLLLLISGTNICRFKNNNMKTKENIYIYIRT